ncbi:hypothetical protein BDZ97DRAFT_1774908 [Flammula alnicola]|nr:hypothetical protein BDZ97DRAFT_1774908 [Flammula alnicola]
MPLEKDYSIVADSTISSSPQPHVDRDSDELDAPTQIRRPTKTYGRRREEPLVEDLDSISIPSSSAPRDSIHHTAPPGLSEEILHPLQGRDSQLLRLATLTLMMQRKMRQLDAAEDDDVISFLSSEHDDAPTHTLFGQPFLLQTTAGPTSDQQTKDGRLVDDSLSRGTQSLSQGPSAKGPFALSSPQVAPPARVRHSKVILDSDSEQEPSKDSSSTTPSSSSQPLHPINTPKSRSFSTTPPTSDDDMPAQPSAKARSKGKRKPASASRASVAPLDLIEGPSSEPKKRNDTQSKRAKIKAPTKKDKTEMLKERSRLAAGSNAFIPRETIAKYTKETLFANIGGIQKRPSMPPTTEPIPASDPIEPYSSPPVNTRSAPARSNAGPSHFAVHAKPRVQQSPSPHDSDNDDLPEVSDMLREAEEQRKKKELQQMKMRALEKLQSKPSTNNDDCLDDLEIMDSTTRMEVEEEHRRKQQLRLANVNASRQIFSKASAPLDVRSTHGDSTSVILQQAGLLDQVKLSRLMATQAQKEARMIAKKKEEEWQKHGGHITVHPGAPAEGLDMAVKTIAEKGLKVAAATVAGKMDIDGEDEDEDDEDWGPASPAPREDADEEQEAEEETDENTPTDKDTIMVDVEDPELEVPKVLTTRRMIVTSDSEEEENDENAPERPASISNQERYRRATSSAELPTEDEQDKENNTMLMYDRSEDKENTAVVRHGRLSNAPLSIFDIGDASSPSLSPSVPSLDWNARRPGLELDDESVAERRRPFQELISEESPSSTHLPSSLMQSFAAQLQQASPLPGTSVPTPKLKPFLGAPLNSSKSFSGFSQFSEGGDSDVFEAGPSLQPGFSDLFESATEKQKSPTRLNKGRHESPSEEALSDENDLRNFKRPDKLDLTQDVTAVISLQPAFHVGENLMRKADAIFEKEQAFVLEAAIKKPSKKPELYINDHGFLTQTRPADGTPEIYRPSPSQTLYVRVSPSQSRPRAPLRTLSISSSYQPESPESLPLQRLRKLVTPPPEADNLLPGSPTSTTPPRKQNAFDILARGAAKAHRHDELKRKRPDVDVSGFFENEAAESDDDDAFGFVRPKIDDDGEDGEDLDKTLDALMDDAEMDEDTVAAELVLEKFKLVHFL